jgi:apolipoprotein D and lipocalin family protein
VILCLALCACAVPATTPGFRDPGRAIYSSAVLAPRQIAGSWVQVADFASKPGCRAAAVTIRPAGPGLEVAGHLCLAGRQMAVSGPLVPVGPGRFALSGLADPLWVLWADADVRTLVLGTPSGRFGMILNREAGLPRDRATAAREVLAWNGYDLERLQIIP